MNIPVLTYRGNVTVRPDQTYRHGQDGLYVPENVDCISWSPAAFVHICKAGRCIGERFASRYYDGVELGVLLYPEDFIDGSEEGYARAICLNNTTYFPDFEALDFQTPGLPERQGIDKALAKVSSACHLRTGDVVAIELAGRSPLCTRSQKERELTYGKVRLKVIF